MIWLILGYGSFDAFMRSAIDANGGTTAFSHHPPFNGDTHNGNEHMMFSRGGGGGSEQNLRRSSTELAEGNGVLPPAKLDLYPELPARHRTPGFLRESESPEAAAVQTYARVVRTTARAAEEEDTLTKIRNLGTFGFQNLG